MAINPNWIYLGASLAPTVISSLGQLYDKLSHNDDQKQMVQRQMAMMQNQMQNGASAQQAADYINQNPNMWRY